MKKLVRVLSLVLACMICFTNIAVVQADEVDQIEDKIDEQKEEQKELENKKEEAKAQKAALKSRLEKIANEMADAKEKLNKKQVEIAEAQDALDEAKIDEREQYADMKLRIQFMYENGDAEREAEQAILNMTNGEMNVKVFTMKTETSITK